MTEFDRMTDDLEQRTASLPRMQRTLFLVAYAQRLASLFAMFEARAPKATMPYSVVLDTLWAGVDGREPPPDFLPQLLSILPGEEWIVDGFYDAIAQYVGGLAVGATQGLIDPAGIDHRPETGIFSCLRPILSEMRLGCMSPAGHDQQEQRFEATLHTEPLIIREAEFWEELLARVTSEPTIDDLRSFVVANAFDPASLEPDLSRGLARDAAEARKFLDDN